MLTERDRQVLKWIEDYKAISVPQATELFFNGTYESCRRRLKQLEDMELLKSYISQFSREKIYYQEKKLKDHELLVYDFLKVVKKRGGEMRQIKLQPQYLKRLIRPDAYIEFTLENNLYFIILEVDYTHYTSNIKMQLYEKLYKEGTLQKQCYGTFPIVIISRPSLNDVRYNSSNFDVIYTDLYYNNLQSFLF
ncbi:hypothetical protein FDC26_16015 [Clostridium botulinum]|uniref:hypothetical protein n=1 Tax=unclassified Clostridium TaxID=2614128 RepID=UPI0013C8EED3|nr:MULTISPECIES: hypothetical protein [unclassified Clostridium]NFM11841.1 hypothetical protein [Clostridium botulinum]NFN78358.1 hypothetical protein [Clostridium botulinum]NFO74634.1 hypothetical protein [Clostridium botulinum]NFO79026.1 hypothetical protein [Clostridium botulinum]NFP05892.1 hypothetical protein [Clostridium botulinum]